MSVLPELQRISRDGVLNILKPVSILHPGCRGRRQSLFALPAFPYPPAPGGLEGPVHGVDHRLALDACRIVTNYAADERDCFLSRDRAGRHPIPRRVGVLAEDKYFYHPGAPSTRTDAEANYPVVTDFAAWRFPEKLPEHWVRPRPKFRAEYLGTGLYRGNEMWGVYYNHDMWYDVTANDGNQCVVTKNMNSYGVFHLVPQSQEAWFARNRMGRFALGGDRTGIHDAANGLSLRLDLGHCLKHHGLVFYPVPEEGPGKFMTYICRWKLDYVERFHRRLVTIAPRVSEEFLYARFAHSMIKLVAPGPSSHLNPFPIPDGVTPPNEEEECECDHSAFMDLGWGTEVWPWWLRIRKNQNLASSAGELSSLPGSRELLTGALEPPETSRAVCIGTRALRSLAEPLRSAVRTNQAVLL